MVPAASWVGFASAPAAVGVPAGTARFTTLAVVALPVVRPPNTLTLPPAAPGTATSRLSGAASCHGSRPDSIAGIPAGAAAWCPPDDTWPETDVVVPPWWPDAAGGGDAALFPPEDPIAYTRTAITMTTTTAPTANVRRRRAMVLRAASGGVLARRA